jgi:hypothetical protein
MTRRPLKVFYKLDSPPLHSQETLFFEGAGTLCPVFGVLRTTGNDSTAVYLYGKIVHWNKTFAFSTFMPKVLHLRLFTTMIVSHPEFPVGNYYSNRGFRLFLERSLEDEECCVVEVLKQCPISVFSPFSQDEFRYFSSSLRCSRKLKTFPCFTQAYFAVLDENCSSYMIYLSSIRWHFPFSGLIIKIDPPEILFRLDKTYLFYSL